MKHINNFEKFKILENNNNIVSPLSLKYLMIEIVDMIDDIKKIINKNRNKISNKIRNFIENFKNKPKEYKGKFSGIKYLNDLIEKDEPSIKLLSKYQEILIKYNGGIKFSIEEMEYEDIVLMYNELEKFKKELEGTLILLKNNIISDL